MHTFAEKATEIFARLTNDSTIFLSATGMAAEQDAETAIGSGDELPHAAMVGDSDNVIDEVQRVVQQDTLQYRLLQARQPPTAGRIELYFHKTRD